MSVKRHHNRRRLVVHRLQRRLAHLLALPPPRRRLLLRFLAVMLPETRIHIALNIHRVLENVAYYSFLDRPPEEIQLAHRRLLNCRLAQDLERDPLAAAEGIKEPLRIGLELTLVMEVYLESTIIDRITDIQLLAVVRHEPIDEPERDR